MKYIGRLVLLSSIILLIFPLFTTSCEFGLILEVENQTDQTLTMRVRSEPCFDVLPHSITKGKTAVLTNDLKYFIDGTNKSGEIVYSKYFSKKELKDTTLKVVISPTEENTYLSLEFENRTSFTIWVAVDGAYIGRIESGASLRNKPLPSDSNTYTIRVEMDVVTLIGKTKNSTSQTILNQTFSRDELEKDNWKIVLFNPETNLP
jgi:hypothetical protein